MTDNFRFLRLLLGCLLLLVAINAFAGGYYGMSGAKDVPVSWLSGSPFTDYFLPSLILFVVVGGSSLAASIAVFRRHPQARKAVFACGLIILVWISVQVMIIGYVSSLQPVITIVGILIIFLGAQLPKILS